MFKSINEKMMITKYFDSIIILRLGMKKNSKKKKKKKKTIWDVDIDIFISRLRWWWYLDAVIRSRLQMYQKMV